jgi:hypothetical protein
MNGSIDCDSEENKWTKFYFVVPVGITDGITESITNGVKDGTKDVIKNGTNVDISDGVKNRIKPVA